MSSNLARGNIVDLSAARARKGQHRDRGRAREPRTVILQASNVRTDAEVHRHIGLNDALSLHDLRDVLVVSFGLAEEKAPWYFTRAGDRLDHACHVHEFLTTAGDTITFHWGLWEFTLTAVDSYPRDRGTPRALCVGGSGAFGGADFDLAEINASLTGRKTIEQVLANTAGPVRGIIDRSEIFDFVPLLQALDLTRDGTLDERTRERLADLPLEEEPAGVDAFWAIVLALACMSDGQLAADVLETTMAALGWVDDDGSALTADRIHALCPGSLERLAEVGAYGPGALAPVDRLDIYRQLLRS
ncbi:hypothetical protein [Corynebacterium halotolerans]|uniref:Uncharacterized protein n=1 Tax=Corynebacterium halotolerans YIM 70093 = DSM 44683 TaxID=1121362 RepID=M1NUT5_9CORY|nr:hypothetical protein [Corynebacterium halotolerans]AGF71275.1 hypothetical protein A605_01305 [Corynebacterium halotolerans YIM 70093 = DSM 44683]